jgi:hypothetical protein
MKDKLYQVTVYNVIKKVNTIDLLLVTPVDVLNLLQHLPFWELLYEKGGYESIAVATIEDNHFLEWSINSRPFDYYLTVKHRYVFNEITQDQLQLITDIL